MQLPHPYIFTSERMVALIDRPQLATSEGPVADPVYGYHSLWIAEVPFITSETAKDFAYQSEKRLENTLRRQQRFLYDLAQLRDNQATFELRLVSWPQKDGPTRVGIAFLGKVFHENRQSSHELAGALWDKFHALFPREAPFSSPLIPISEENASRSQQTRSFANWYQPLPLEVLDAPECIVELRKYEDWPTIRGVGGILQARDYIPQPFEPALDYSALGGLFQALAQQRHTCVVSITLRPQSLTDQEKVLLYELLGWYRRLAEGLVTLENPLADVLLEIHSDVIPVYLRTRGDIGIKVYETLIRELDHLFTARLQVIGFPDAQHDLLEALGSEMTADVERPYPSRWARVSPSPDELRWARFNLQWLEFARWGISSPIRQAPVLTRLRQLVTASEAMGAFRLPVASSGGLAGVEVRDEPFLLPPQNEELDNTYPLGMLQDRGVTTTIPCLLPRKVFTKPIPVLGRKGVGRNAVTATLLQAASTRGLSWVLMHESLDISVDKVETCYVQRIALDALSGQPAQPVIQPFFPPPGVALPLFVDALQRVLTVICKLEPASAIVLRQALLNSYLHMHASTQPEGLGSLIWQLKAALQQIDMASDLLSALELQVILPLQDMLMTTKTLFEASPVQSQGWWTIPTCIEIGWLGSEQTRAMVRGCLWAYCGLAFSESAKKIEGMRGVVGIENAHSIFAALPETMKHLASPTTSLAQLLAQRGVCTLLIDERADLLDQGIANAIEAIIVTANSNAAAQQRADMLIRASARQSARMRLLQANEAVVLMPGIDPLLITV